MSEKRSCFLHGDYDEFCQGCEFKKAAAEPDTLARRLGRMAADIVRGKPHIRPLAVSDQIVMLLREAEKRIADGG